MSPNDPTNYQPGDRHVITLAAGVELVFRFIPAGEFRIGSRGKTRSEEPVHHVRVSHSYWLSETPVTQAQFACWTENHDPSHTNDFPARPDHPAEHLDWWQAVRFCRWLTEGALRQFPLGSDFACLPTEAEWEYACRAGSETDYFTGDDELALVEAGWFGDAGKDGASTYAVGRKSANAFGLLDTHGNVWEFCHDLWDATAYRKRIDGESESGWNQRRADYRRKLMQSVDPGIERLMRGGSWVGRAAGCRSAFRNNRESVGRFHNLGFRVCLATMGDSPELGQANLASVGGLPPEVRIT